MTDGSDGEGPDCFVLSDNDEVEAPAPNPPPDPPPSESARALPESAPPVAVAAPPPIQALKTVSPKKADPSPRRPPRPTIQRTPSAKRALFVPDLTDESDPPDPGPKTAFPQSPIEAFEASIVFRLEKSLFTLRHSFVHDFQSLVNDMLGFEREVNGCISQIKTELEEILKPGQSSSSSTLNFSALVLPGFEILGGLPRRAGPPISALQESPFQESLLAPARAIFGDFMAERGLLVDLRIKTDESERALQHQKNARLALEARAVELDIEAESIAKQRKRCAPIAKTGQENPDLEKGIPDLIDLFRGIESGRASLRLANWSEKTAQQIQELCLANGRLAAKAETVARSIQLFDDHSREPVRTVAPDTTGAITDIEAKLTEIRRRRVEVMRDVNRMMAELTSG
jgi:hypothetical protein